MYKTTQKIQDIKQKIYSIVSSTTLTNEIKVEKLFEYFEQQGQTMYILGQVQKMLEDELKKEIIKGV